MPGGSGSSSGARNLCHESLAGVNETGSAQPHSKAVLHVSACQTYVVRSKVKSVTVAAPASPRRTPPVGVAWPPPPSARSVTLMWGSRDSCSTQDSNKYVREAPRAAQQRGVDRSNGTTGAHLRALQVASQFCVVKLHRFWLARADVLQVCPRHVETEQLSDTGGTANGTPGKRPRSACCAPNTHEHHCRAIQCRRGRTMRAGRRQTRAHRTPTSCARPGPAP